MADAVKTIKVNRFSWRIFGSGFASGVVVCSSIWATLAFSMSATQSERIRHLLLRLRQIDLGMQIYEQFTGHIPDNIDVLVNSKIVSTDAGDFALISNKGGTVVVPKRTIALNLDGGRGESSYRSIDPRSNFLMTNGRIIFFDRAGQITAIDTRERDRSGNGF